MQIDNICIEGLGTIGKKYLDIFQKKFKFKKIILLRSKKKKKIEGKNLFEVYSLAEAKKLKPQAVIICTPTSLHVKSALYFCKNKIPMLIEKPISNTLNGLHKLKILQKKNKTRIQIGYVLKFKKELESIKKKIKNQKILSVDIVCKSNLKDWRKNKNYKKFNSSQKSLGGGVLLELSHEIDYARYLFGEIKSIYCTMGYSKNLNIDVEDYSHIVLITKNNILINMHLSFSSKEIIRECQILTSKFILKWNLVKNSILKNNKLIYQDNTLFIENYVKQLKYFFKNLNSFKEDVHSLENSVKTLKVILAGKISNQKQKEIYIK